MQLPDLIGMYLNKYLIEPIGNFLNISESIIIFILIGIGIIIFGYWTKLYVNSFNRSPYVKENIEKLRNKQILRENISFGQKITLWIEDGKCIKLCNKIGLAIILISIIYLSINKIF